MQRLPTARAATALLALTFLTACGPQGPPPPPPLRTARYEKVKVEVERRERTFSGVAQAGVESKLSFKVDGTVQDVSVAVGDRVSKNDPIARLDPTDLTLALGEADAALALAIAGERNAVADYERIRGLYENDNTSLSSLDAARAAADSAKAQVSASQKRRDLMAQRLSYTRLRAPVDGAVAKVLVEENENVAAGMVVAVMISGTQPEVTVAVPESVIVEVKQGETVAIRFDALPDRQFQGVVSEVGVMASATQTYPVTVTLQGDTTALRAGMSAEVSFDFTEKGGRRRVVVPTQAVGKNASGNFVYVLEPVGDDEAVAHVRTVQVGALVQDGIEVTSGLRDGELVVTAGLAAFEEGRRVSLAAGAS